MDIGIVPGMINSFPTHNRFVSFDSDFTVFETRPGEVDEVISIGIRDAVIEDDIIITPMPEPATLTLSGLGLLMLAFARRRRNDG